MPDDLPTSADNGSRARPTMETPVVSVVIPLFNKREYVLRAIGSVLGQSWQDLELLVIDDGSTDEGGELVAAVRDPRLRLIRQPNGGPGAARNRGIKEASAPLVAFLDADDEWAKDHLEQAIKALADHPECALFVSGFLRGPDRTDMGESFQRWELADGLWRPRPQTTAEQLRRQIDTLCPPAVVARREVLVQLGGFYDAYRCTYGEDSYLWIKLVLNHAICRSLQPTVWVHTECSELGVGRRTHRLKPALTDPQPLRQRCPAHLRGLLEAFLNESAMRSARTLALTGNRTLARQVLAGFPQAASLGWPYTRTRLIVAMAPLYWAARRIGLMKLLRRIGLRRSK